MSLQANKFLFSINNYVPGKSKINHSKIIKLSSNENALGVSQKAIEAYKKHSDKLFRYPDGNCTDLCSKLAEVNNIDSAKIICGAGSDEIISLLTAAFATIDDEVIYSEYGFLMYPISAQKVGAKAVKVAENNLTTNTDNILAAITNKTKIIFIANPNNPTGSYISSWQLQNFLNKVPDNILIVLDNAYQEFVQQADYPCNYDLVNKYKNLVITRTFSKVYGLASLRIGWCYADNYVVDVLHKVRGPFNVSGAAQLSAIAALEDIEFLQKSVQHNQYWLNKFTNFFAKFTNVKQYPSVANFVLLDFFNVQNCLSVNQKLLDYGIIIREMSAYNLSSCLRLSIGNDQENQYVLEVFEKILS